MSQIKYRTQTQFAILFTVILCLIPVTVYAQYIPVEFIAAALSPLLAIALAIILGFISRNLRAGAIHVILLICWVILFCLAAYFIENDYIIWTPLVIYAAHCALIIVLIVIHTIKRILGSTGGDKK